MERQLRENIMEFLKKEKSIAKNVRKKFLRYDIVPRAYIRSLKADDFRFLDINWPLEKMTIDELAKLLDGTYKMLAIKKYPEIHKSFFPEATYSTKRH